MANETETLATIHDSQTDVVITVSRLYQEAGGTGIEIVVEREHATRRVLEVFQVKDLTVHY